jgi:hypothetical protein
MLANACATYKDSGLWDYEFKIKFESDTNYLRVPLSTFATDSDQLSRCVIYVEMLDDDEKDSRQIMFGSMLF